MPTTLTAYLSFDGRTREAFDFYAQTLDAQIVAMLRWSDMPAPPAAGPPADAQDGCSGPAPTGDGIMHACLALPGGAMLMAGDTPPGMPFEGMQGVMLALQYDTVDQAQAKFGALAAGGQITMPMAPAFWAECFGMLTDRFGVSWAVNGAPIPIPIPTPVPVS